MEGGALLEGNTQGSVQAVLQEQFAAPPHRVREQIAGSVGSSDSTRSSSTTVVVVTSSAKGTCCGGICAQFFVDSPWSG